MKYIIDIPNEMVIKSALNGLTLGIAMIETSTQKQFIIPTNIPLMPYIEPQKWIPVYERLPKVGVNVLVCDIDSDIYLTHMSPYKSFYDEFCDYIKNVKAWMPLPEPWKGEEE